MRLYQLSIFGEMMMMMIDYYQQHYRHDDERRPAIDVDHACYSGNEDTWWDWWKSFKDGKFFSDRLSMESNFFYLYDI